MGKNKNEQKNKLFGRNTFTMLFILIGGIVLFLVVFTISSYVSIGNQNDVTPFVTKDADGCEVQFDVENVTRMDAKDFNEFKLEFQCTDYKTSTGTAQFKIKAYKNENTRNVNSNTKLKVALCLASDWVGFASYSSEELSRTLEINEKEDGTKSTTLTISNIISYPAKANTWPVPVTVNSPDAYLYVSYTYYKNDNVSAGETETKNYILKYSYSEFDVQAGGLVK